MSKQENILPTACELLDFAASRSEAYELFFEVGTLYRDMQLELWRRYPPHGGVVSASATKSRVAIPMFSTQQALDAFNKAMEDTE